MNQVFIGNNKSEFENKIVEGGLIEIDNELYCKILNVDVMRPFFMSIVSNSNHWMFVSSNGGLTAGRKDCDMALFPYYTDDKITEFAETTGSKTSIQVHASSKIYLWEPFSNKYEGVYKISRNLYKNSIGNKIIFEEINHQLGITYRYQWSSSNLFGFIKKSTIINHNSDVVKIKILDGIQNIIPFGVSAELQNTRSNLVDAYKKSELEDGIGIYTLSSIIVDRAEPSEALKSTLVSSLGLENPTYLISSRQLDDFRRGENITSEIDIRAEKGAYFVVDEFTIEPSSEIDWMLIANVNQSITDLNLIKSKRENKSDLYIEIQNDIDLGSKQLSELVGNSDGLQVSEDKLLNIRHFSNTLFNIMRGGIFDHNYQIEKSDFIKFIKKANKKVALNKVNLLQELQELFSLNELYAIAEKDEDKSFKRLCFEYMPLKFSRRHGDPSRPWNRFSINTQNEIDGSKVLDYEGNWRDIFQNWEALAHSYPEFIESMIHKFLNASTFDGYNPYRVTKDGFDWEVIEPNDPWSYIGYWGDHQIIYLLKFLEFIENHYPNKLAQYFNQDVFVYANVPYKIKGYSEILNNPKDTIIFDDDLDNSINKKKTELGFDGALLTNRKNHICEVNLIEKLLATVLAKCSNFIPEAGIWLNTQRPEWNDANNALVGNGVSMVTLYYLRRFLKFFKGITSGLSNDGVSVSEEIAAFFEEIVSTFDSNEHILSKTISNKERKNVVDGLGNAGSNYRDTIYKNGFSSRKENITKKELTHFLDIALEFLEHSIKANKRADNLYHAYNLMTIENESEISINYLSEMLEGQVAALSSGYISSFESLDLLDSLKKSELFREDQSSYLLYPNKDLGRFINKNFIASEKIEKSSLLKQLLKDGNSQIIEKDVLGNHHFNANFNNANSLSIALSNLSKDKYAVLVSEEKENILTIFEEVFNHKFFTGRSGTFFGYEGLGSIYWHMVSKLVVAVQECCIRAINNKESEEVVERLLAHYYEINEGIGVHKSPEIYGAFSTDPYSHTPENKGAQQPGMTGQVKEDILSRFGELGVSVKNGMLQFNPAILKKTEFLKEKKVFNYVDVNSSEKELVLNKGSLCFTYCQVPIIYELVPKKGVEVVFNDNIKLSFNSLNLNEIISKQLFERKGTINCIHVMLGND